MTFELTILGSSSALPKSNRFPSAHVLNVHERLFLMDCAEGTQMQLRRYNLKLSRIESVFISHIHGDHVLGLVGLISTFNLLGRERPLTVFAHESFEGILRQNLKFFVKDSLFPVHFIPVQDSSPQIIYHDSKVTVESVPLNHRIPTVGYIVREQKKQPNIRKELIAKYSISLAQIHQIKQGSDLTTPDGVVIPNSELTYSAHTPRSYAYLSDTRYHQPLADAVKGVDLLYHEATFDTSLEAMAKKTGHSTARQAALIAQKAKVGKLIIGHFSSRYNNLDPLLKQAQEVFPNTFLAYDGDKYNVCDSTRTD